MTSVDERSLRAHDAAMDVALTVARRLPLLAFALACEAIEANITASFEAAQKAAARGDRAEAMRLFDASERYQAELESLIEGQLAATGTAKPSAPVLAA
jgi:hypothetical protein